MATIVDSLIVTLGLDPSDFTRGQKSAVDSLVKGQKQAQKSVKETDAAVSKGAKEMGKAITGAARQFALAFLGFSGAAGFTKFMANLNQMARATKMSASNLDMNASALQRWNNVAELAGSSAETMTGFLEQIQAQQYQQQTTGLPGWFKELRSMDNFQLLDHGKAKAETQVALELADAYAKVRDQLGQDTAVQRFKTMGIDPSMINMLGRGRAWIEQQLARQQKRYGNNDKAFDAADSLSRRYTDIKQLLSDRALDLLAKLQPTLDRWLAKFDEWLGKLDMDALATQIEVLATEIFQLGQDLGGFLTYLQGFTNKAGDILKNPMGSFENWTKDKTKRLMAQPAIDAEVQNDPVLFRLSRAVRSDFSGNFPSSIGSLVDSASGGNEGVAAQLLESLTKATGKGVDDKLDKAAIWKIREVIDAIARSRVQPAATTGGLTGVPNALQAAQGAGASARVASVGASSTSSTVSVGNVNIYGAGSDGRRIAGDFERELQRKGLIAQANTGLA